MAGVRSFVYTLDPALCQLGTVDPNLNGAKVHEDGGALRILDDILLDHLIALIVGGAENVDLVVQLAADVGGAESAVFRACSVGAGLDEFAAGLGAVTRISAPAGLLVLVDHCSCLIGMGQCHGSAHSALDVIIALVQSVKCHGVVGGGFSLCCLQSGSIYILKPSRSGFLLAFRDRDDVGTRMCGVRRQRKGIAICIDTGIPRISILDRVGRTGRLCAVGRAVNIAGIENLIELVLHARRGVLNGDLASSCGEGRRRQQRQRYDQHHEQRQRFFRVFHGLIPFTFYKTSACCISGIYPAALPCRYAGRERRSNYPKSSFLYLRLRIYPVTTAESIRKSPP